MQLALQSGILAASRQETIFCQTPMGIFQRMHFLLTGGRRKVCRVVHEENKGQVWQLGGVLLPFACALGGSFRVDITPCASRRVGRRG
jgi:hypothetical protein